jgi:hypothetical protein
MDTDLRSAQIAALVALRAQSRETGLTYGPAPSAIYFAKIAESIGIDVFYCWRDL